MRHKSIFILGRQPAIGRAELESLFGATHLMPIGDHAMGCDVAPEEIDFNRIGGSMRLAKPLDIIETTRWPDVARAVGKKLPHSLDELPAEGKLKLGISAYGFSLQPSDLLRTGLELKKICKKIGRSVRIVPNVEVELNSAQVIHNHLTGDLGMELLFVRDGNSTFVAQTLAVQDIDAYAARDQGRPKRDAFVGMLPPKLAQTIVNLGVGQTPPSTDTVVLDPFCGTGVVLQEALLMGYSAYGTDLEPRMVEYTDKNLEWLQTYNDKELGSVTTEVGDATEHKWSHSFSVVAGETYLGRPLSGWPNPEKLQEIIGTCNIILQKFLRNLADQTPSGTRLCLAMPAWAAPNGRIYHLSLLDSLEVMGYNRVSFSWAQEQEMVYHRPDQLVARELVVITRK